MYWKSWPYWLKGGVIGASYFTTTYFFIVYPCTFHPTEACGMEFVVFNYPAEIIHGMLPIPSSLLNWDIQILMLDMLLGGILGFLYGKFKDRKQLSVSK